MHAPLCDAISCQYKMHTVDCFQQLHQEAAVKPQLRVDLLVYADHSPMWDIQEEDDGSTLRQFCSSLWVNMHFVWGIHWLSCCTVH